jgi:hypothetical protein
MPFIQQFAVPPENRQDLPENHSPSSTSTVLSPRFALTLEGDLANPSPKHFPREELTPRRPFYRPREPPHQKTRPGKDYHSARRNPHLFTHPTLEISKPLQKSHAVILSRTPPADDSSEFRRIFDLPPSQFPLMKMRHQSIRPRISQPRVVAWALLSRMTEAAP